MVDDAFGLVGRRLGGRYEIEAVVAAGGFGVVYRGSHVDLRRSVAIKVLTVRHENTGVQRAVFVDAFKAEAQRVAQLEHPAVVQVLDFGVSEMPSGESQPWMVLEWVEGQTLKADLQARREAGGRSPRECLALLRPVIEALALAHQRGIAHRDVKPANIMLPARREGELGLLGSTMMPSSRLLDFGIAKVMRPDDDVEITATSEDVLAFTLSYAAPEQVGGKKTGPWTDVHAVGLVLTEMLTDRAPYGSGDKMSTLRAVIGDVRPTPAQFGVDVGAWEPVIKRALSLTPAERFINAERLLDALEASLPHATKTDGAPAPTIVEPPEGAVAEPIETTTPPSVSTSPSSKRRLVIAGAVGVTVLIASASWIHSRTSGVGLHPTTVTESDASAPRSVRVDSPAPRSQELVDDSSSQRPTASPASPAPVVVDDSPPPAYPPRAVASRGARQRHAVAGVAPTTEAAPAARVDSTPPALAQVAAPRPAPSREAAAPSASSILNEPAPHP